MSKGADAVSTMIVRGVEYDVRLDVTAPTKFSPQGHVRFTAQIFGKDISAETLEDLYARAMTASKQRAVKISIPLLKLELQANSWSPPTSFRPVTLTGQHQVNGNFLIRRQVRAGKDVTEQTDRYDVSNSYFKLMSKEAQTEGLQLMVAERKASEALSQWRHDHEADLVRLFDEAEREAMEKLDREEGR